VPHLMRTMKVSERFACRVTGQQRRDPSAALESSAAILFRPAESLLHSVDGDHRDGRQFHGRRSLLAGFCRRSIRPDRGADLIGRSRVGPVDSFPPRTMHALPQPVRGASWESGGSAGISGSL
jgi:hypothetical protein